MVNTTLSGRCFCGEVASSRLIPGRPVAMGYCHCDSCRTWSAGPVNAFSLWNPEVLKVTRGAQNIGTFHKTERSYAKWCTKCGGHLFHGSSALEAWSTSYAAVLPQLKFEPGVHVHYQETVLHLA